MKNSYLLSGLTFLILIISPAVFASKPGAFINRIEGTVYSPDRVGVENVYIELLTDTYSTISQTRTNSAGRFSLSNMSAGKFLVKAKPIGMPYLEQTQEVYITNLTTKSSDMAYVEIYLQADKRASDSVQKSPESIFVQDVPPAAKKLFEEAKTAFSQKQDEGFTKIDAALDIFPTYFDALNLIGKEYIARLNFEKAYPYLIKAIDVNQRSFSNYYRLAYSFYQLKQYPAAMVAVKASIVLVPDSADAQLLYGTLLRIDGRYADAEPVLLKANTLANGKNFEAHHQLALLYNRLNKNQAAVDELQSMLKLAPPDFPGKDDIQKLIDKLQAAASKPK